MTEVKTNGRVRVKVGSTSWIYNKLDLTLVAKSGKLEVLQRSTQKKTILCCVLTFMKDVKSHVKLTYFGEERVVVQYWGTCNVAVIWATQD